jgi:GH25 family lysozyme M1 (1,4-beta-N-acetylmuramidase)
MTIFGIDASSNTGSVNWAAADPETGFGFEKVTEGTHYANPFWPAAREALSARAKATGLVPGAYLFLDAGASGAAQADWFASCAGNLDGFAIAADFERAPDGPPALGQAQACVARLRSHYPHHPIGLYAPHWFTGGEDLSFGDWLWASSYVIGTGSPQALYAKVPGIFWAQYGGRSPLLLQFTSSVRVAGAAGPADCSAFKGTQAGLRAAVLGKKVPKVTIGSVKADGKLSLSQLAAQHSTGASTVLRLTAEHGKYSAPVADYINAVFSGKIPPSAPIPAGSLLWVPVS